MSNYWKKKLDELNEEEKKKKQNSKTTEKTSNTSNYWQNKMNELEAESQKKDIAPVKQTTEKEEKKWYQGWFDKGAFDDGYQFGDVSKSIIGSVQDVRENLISGVIGMGEKAVDAGAYLVGAVGGAFSDDFKEDTKKFIAKDLYDEKKVAEKIVKGTSFAESLIADSDDSFLGDKTDSVLESGGQLLGTVALQAVGVPWFVTTGVTSFGGEVENAFNQDATYAQAGASAAISAGAEILTEKLSGGINFGAGTLDDVLTKKLATSISNKTVRTMAKLGMDVVGEGAEEIVSQVFSNLGSSLYKEEKLSDILFSEEAVNEYIESFIGGAVLGGTGSVSNVVKSAITGRDATSGLTANEEKVFKQIYDERIAEAEQDGKKLSTKEKTAIYDEIMRDMEKGYISTDKIESILGGETYKSYQDTIAKEESTIKELESLYEGEELENAIKDIMDNSKRTELKNQLSKEVSDLAVQGKDSYLSESYFESERRKQAFEADLTKYDEKTQEHIKRAIDSGVLNNTRRTHEFVDMISKISADKGVLFDFTDNAKLKESGFAVDGKTVNGYVTKDGVTLNIDSEKSLNSIVSHEITHVLEGTEFYNALQDTIFEYDKTKGVYKDMLKSTYDLYKNIDGYKGAEGFDAIKREVVSDLVGDYLFTDPDFINHLSKDRNVFQKIYDEIKYLYKVATAGSKEARQLEKVKHAFEQAYKGESKASGDTKYSISDSDGKKLTKEQNEYFKDSKMRDENGNLKVMYHGSQDAGFHTFDAKYSDDDTSFFFVDRNDVAASYSGTTETYEAQTIRTAEDMNKFIESIDAEGYEVIEKDGKFTLLYEGDRVADSDTAQGIYKEFCWYEGVGEGDANYKVYLNLTNPLEVDAKGKNWNNISREFSQEVADRYNSLTAEEKAALSDLAEWGEYSIFKDEMLASAKGGSVLASAYEKLGGANANLYDAFSIASDNFSAESIKEFAVKQMNTRDYAKKAKAEGYDGVIFKNIHDNGGYSNGSEGASTVAIAFNSNQIKSVANQKPTEKADIRYSLSEYTAEEKKAHNDAVLKHFGKTYKWAETGYLLLDGTRLDLSGKHDGAPGGYRTVDHMDITDALGYDYGGGEYSGSLVQFMSEGNIRIVPEINGINLSVKPTKEQERSLSDYISKNRGEVLLDIDDLNGNTVVSVEYPRGTYYTKVLDDIREWFDNGKKPEVSGFSQFYSLTKNGNTKTHGKYNVYGKDVRLEKDIAPVGETVETVGETVPQTENKVAYDLSPEPITEEEANALQSENVESLTDEDAPPETEAPYYGDTEEVAPSDPFLERDIDDVGNRKVKAYMYENPEVKTFFQSEANVMLGELRDTTKGERWYNDKLYYESNGERGFFGTKRHTTPDIAYLLDELGYSYAEIEKGLNDIIEDNGKENNACSKRIEFILNDRLLKGYQDIDGANVPADQDYIRLLHDKEIIEYNEEARKKFFEVADDYAPVYEQQELFDDNKKNTAPVSEGQRKLFDDAKAEKKPFRGTQQKMFGTPEEEKVAKVWVGEPEAPKKKSRTSSQIVTDYIDKGAPVEKLALKTKNRELQAKYNFMHYSEQRAQNYIKNNLKPLLDKIENTGKTQEVFEYAYHLHNIDRMSIDTEENRAKREELRGKYFDGKSDKQIEQTAHQWITRKTPKEEAERIKAAREYVDANMTKNKPVFGDTVTADVSREAVKKFEAENPEFIELEKEILKYNERLRKLLVDNNLISQETADMLAKMYPHYVPIRRLEHEGAAINVPLDSRKTGVNAPIKRATGGNSDIGDLGHTMALRTEQIFKAVARNNFGLELMHTLDSAIDSNDASFDEIMDNIDNQDELMNKGELLKKGENGKAPTFTVFENGKRVEFEITEDLYDSMKPVGERLSKTYLSSKAVDAFKKVTTTYSPKFMVSNPIKDFQDIILNSQHPMKTYANMPKAFLELATHGRYYTEYMENGGEQNTYFDSQKKTFTEESLAKKIAFGLPRGINMANDFFERAPRLAEYMASRKKGASIETAMLDAARVTTNFSAGGDVTKFVGRNFVPFLNPSVQGAAQQVRNVREAAAEGFTGVLKLAGKYAVAGIPALMLNALLWDDDEEYEELSDYVKENYYVVAKFDDGKFVRIPKGRTVAVIQSAVEQALNALNGEGADFASTGKLALSNLAPNNPLDSNILSTFIQIKNNKTWYGEELVPSRLQDMPEAEQYDESTDLISKWLGEKLNVSPYKINYLIDQYTGGIGDMILPMLTPEAESGDNSLMGNLVAPWKDLFTTDSVMKNQNVSDFYETVDELTKNANSAYATDEDILKSKFMNSMSAEIGELYARKRTIQNGKAPDDKKYELVRSLQQQIDTLAELSLRSYEGVNIDGNYATVGGLHYRMNDNGVWEKISDKQLEKQNNVTRNLGISASDYWSNKEEYDYAYDYPEKYAVASVVGGYESFKTYSSELYDIKADKDESGKTISGSRKEKVIDYINNLDADYYEKIILFKSEYNADDTYNYEIIDYLNSRGDLSRKDIETILKELGFTVDSKGNISW